MFAGDAQFLASNTARVTKFALPSPFLITIRYWHQDYSRNAYPTYQHLLDHLAEILAREARAAAEAGIDIVQVDDPALTYYGSGFLAAGESPTASSAVPGNLLRAPPTGSNAHPGNHSDGVWVTTLPPQQAPTARIVAWGHQRWDIEYFGFNELVNGWEAFLLMTFLAYNIFHAFIGLNLKPQLRDSKPE